MNNTQGTTMNNLFKQTSTITLLGTLAFIPPLQAEGVFSVGAGAFIGAQEYVGSSGKVYPIPFIEYESEQFSINPLEASYHFFLTEDIWIDAIASARLQGFDESLSDQLKGINERDNAIDAGIQLNYFTDYFGHLSMSIMHDISNVHQGNEIQLNYEYTFDYGNVDLSPSLFVNRQNGNLVDYYYGVEAKESKANRKAYQGEATFNYGVGLSLDYHFNEAWTLFTMANLTRFGSGIADSSIVENDYAWSSGLGFVYSF
ncbi:MipA/OmpV family protein [Aliivibrio kagoshimensis]|uniref:MipA/OmpV family protein n=1 Tax=Aliivibrio kagoshimensis TaxID=2910230 RepID=UPI003D100A7C